jgi:predicted nucleotidyltransferase
VNFSFWSGLIEYLNDSLKQNGLTGYRLALFGSHLSGKNTAESDLDLIIISDNFEGKDIFERGKITMTAELKTLKKFMIPLDILKLTRDEFENAIASKRYSAEIL